MTLGLVEFHITVSPLFASVHPALAQCLSEGRTLVKTF